MILEKMEESLAAMEQSLKEIEGRASSVQADFYRAHFEGCKKLVALGREYQDCTDPERREILKNEMTLLGASLEQSLPMLRIDNNN